MDSKPFWGSRETGSKGMRHDNRLIWHYFTWKNLWANPEGFYSVCHAQWQFNGWHIRETRDDKPPRTECCAQCHAIYQRKEKLNASKDSPQI